MGGAADLVEGLGVLELEDWALLGRGVSPIERGVGGHGAVDGGLHRDSRLTLPLAVIDLEKM